jgi:hypothetical protein
MTSEMSLSEEFGYQQAPDIAKVKIVAAPA